MRQIQNQIGADIMMALDDVVHSTTVRARNGGGHALLRVSRSSSSFVWHFLYGCEPRVTALSGGFRRGQGYKGEEGKRRVEEATHRTTRWLDSPRASLSLCAAVRLYVPNNSYDRMYL